METIETKKQAQKQEKKSKPVTTGLYKEYTKLKFIKLDGGQLREEIEKEFQSLEKEIKTCTGNKAKVTQTLAFGSQLVKLVEGIPVPDEVYKFVKENAKNLKKYF